MNEPELTSDTGKLKSGWPWDDEETLRRMHALTDEQWREIFDETKKLLVLENPETIKPITLIYCRDPMVKRSWKNFFFPPSKKFFILDKDGTMRDILGCYGGLPVPRKHEKFPGSLFPKK